MLNSNLFSIRSFILSVVGLAGLSCVRPDCCPDIAPDIRDSYPIKVYVDSPQKMTGVKSKFTSDQMSRLTDLNIFMYHQGQLVAEHGGYYDDVSSLMLSFPIGKDGFNIYMFGNVGPQQAPQEESEISQMTYVLDSYESFRDHGVPVMGVFMDYRRGVRAEFPLKRLVGQFDISMRVSADNVEYHVKDVRLMNCARDVYPFSESTGASLFTRSFQYGQDSAGDMLTEDDIRALNAGEAVSLYFVENLQGELLPDNVDPKLKIPSSIPQSASARCTYVEITADVSTAAARYTDCKYRFYPGKNETTDFSIVRNTLYEVVLDFTQNMVNEEDWRIEASQPQVSEVLFSKSEVNISPYGNDTLYAYSKTCNIKDVLDMKAVEFTDNYNKKHIQVQRELSEYQGFHAYRFIVGASSRYDGVPVGHVYGEDLQPRDVTYGKIVSTETFNLSPLISQDIKVNFYHKTSPLLLKLEKVPGGAIYQIVLRGYNPLKRKITVSASYTYAGKTASTKTVTVTDIGLHPTYVGALNFDVSPQNLTRIDFTVLIDGQMLALSDDCLASYGPDADMYPARFDNMPEDDSMSISYWDDGWMPLFEGEKMNVNYARCWSGSKVYLSNCIENPFGVSPGDGLNSRPISGGDFYFLNACMQIKDVYVSYAAMVKYPNEAIRGADAVFWGAGRDLFAENADGTLMDNDHTMSFWIATWKNLLGKIKSRQESKRYSGQLYMTINGCSCWPGADASEYGCFPSGN